MRLSIAIIVFLFSITSIFCQSNFSIANNKQKVVLPFQLINNLIFIPIKVNGEELTFLLDTGVEETILFSLDDKEQIQFYQIEKIQLKGLGNNEAVAAYKSSKNKLEANGFVDFNHEIYLVLDQEFNFSSQVGIPVNGIIGYHFFKDHRIEINYERKKITVYADTNKKVLKKLKRNFNQEPISIESNKPYFISAIKQDGNEKKSKLLLDTGNSDALWIFLNRAKNFNKPNTTIFDFLGRGFSGDIFGLRGRIDSFTFGEVTFEHPITVFPDSISVKSVNFVTDRVGSIGGEVLSRFKLVFDYKNNYIYSQTNQKINEPFNYNMSGIDVEHSGLEWIKQDSGDKKPDIKIYTSADDEKVQNNLQIRFELKPIFKISNVRVDSNAQKAGLKKGDKILSINGHIANELTIEKINELLKSEDGKVIKIEIERNNLPITYKFKLKSIL